ncbi:MAG: type II secretion system protein [Patescibacteria group bacterium]
MKRSSHQSGFTLLEVLLVVAAIAILAGIVILAINPTKQLGDTRNTQRRADVNTILSAVYQYAIDHRGNIPSTIATSTTEICQTSATSCTGMINLSVLTADEKYLVSLPIDPSSESLLGTGYYISKSTSSRVTVSAPSAEQSAVISVTR